MVVWGAFEHVRNGAVRPAGLRRIPAGLRLFTLLGWPEPEQAGPAADGLALDGPTPAHIRTVRKQDGNSHLI